MENAAED